MRYVYTTNLDDFKAAHRLLQKQCPRIRSHFVIWHRLMPCVGVVALVLLLHDMVFQHFSYPAWAGGLLAAGAYLGLSSVIYRPFQIRKMYRAMKNGRLDDEPIEMEIVGHEFISRIPMTSEGRFQRASIRDRYEDARILVIFVSNKSFLMLPRRTLPDSAFAEVRAWLISPPTDTAEPAINPS